MWVCVRAYAHMHEQALNVPIRLTVPHTSVHIIGCTSLVEDSVTGHIARYYGPTVCRKTEITRAQDLRFHLWPPAHTREPGVAQKKKKSLSCCKSAGLPKARVELATAAKRPGATRAGPGGVFKAVGLHGKAATGRLRLWPEEREKN